MLQSRNRLLKDIERWQSAGWLTHEGAAAIRADIASRRSGIGLAGVLATLAAVLVGFSVMSFVAANWQEMPKLARLMVIAAGLWSAFGGALWLEEHRHPYFSEAAMLAGVAIFGAGIMLIAQMYHMDGHPPDAVLLWAAGAVATGLLTRSNSVLAASLVLFCFWSQMETFAYTYRGNVHLAFLPTWALVAAGFAMTRWRPGKHLLALALSFWIVQAGYLVGRYDSLQGHTMVTLIGVALCGLSVGLGEQIDKWRPISGAMLAYGFGIAYAGAFALQFVVRGSGELLLLTGTATLLAVIATLWWAWRTDNRPVLWLAYAAFSVEIFALYIKKIGTLLGTSAFFLVAGLLVAALAWAAMKMHGTNSSREGETA